MVMLVNGIGFGRSWLRTASAGNRDMDKGMNGMVHLGLYGKGEPGTAWMGWDGVWFGLDTSGGHIT